jgi:hypothetical protein
MAHAVAMMLPPSSVRVGKPLHEGGKVVVAHRPEQKVSMVGHQSPQIRIGASRNVSPTTRRNAS